MTKRIYSSLLLLLAGVSAHSQSVTYNYTGSVQTFTVPACVTAITVDALGASGGNNGTYLGGSGGRVQATVPVTPGEVLQIYVGQVGVNATVSNPGVYNGGGGVFSYVSAGTSGTGGGATDIRRTPYANADRMIVAGGGGGGGYVNIGGHGGGLIGLDGVPYISWPNSGGKGGTQSAGGAQGVACCSCPTYTTAGSLGQGGNGSGDGAGGGGGGGGYYGGGGSCFAGGGGGSSYTVPAATGVTHTQGYNVGNGQVIITYTVGGGAPATPGSVTGPGSVCAGSSAAYSIGNVAGATTYTWTVPSGATITSGQGTTSVTVAFGTTSGNVTVTASNTCGSSSAQVFTVTINALPFVNIGPDAAYCGYLNLSAGNPGSTYLWSDASTNQTLHVTATGAYSVIVTNASGCSAADTINVTVFTPPTVALGSDITQCGGSVTLDAGNVGANLYQWSDMSTAQTLTVTSSGSYSIYLLDSNNCEGSDTINVTIHPAVNASASASSLLPCLADAPVALAGTPVNGTWSGPGVAGSLFIPSTAGVGSYTLVYSYTDSLTGCSDTAQLNIGVDICLNTMSNGNNNGLSVYPNPVTDVISIQSTHVLATYTITDVTGRVAATGTFIGGQSTTVNAQGLAAGTYVLNATTAEGVSYSTQFVKK